jgi:hypothetical protein
MCTYVRMCICIDSSPNAISECTCFPHILAHLCYSETKRYVCTYTPKLVAFIQYTHMYVYTAHSIPFLTADVWSVGCIMAELLTRQVTFPGNDRILILWSACLYVHTYVRTCAKFSNAYLYVLICIHKYMGTYTCTYVLYVRNGDTVKYVHVHT